MKKIYIVVLISEKFTTALDECEFEQYQKLLELDEVKLEFADDALEASTLVESRLR